MNRALNIAGLIALVVGFLGGALTAIMEVDRVAWGSYLAMAALAIVGVAIMRTANRAQSSSAEQLQGQMTDIRESLTIIERESGALVAEHAPVADPPAGRLGTYDLPGAIDERFPAAISRFVDAREALARVYGTQTYADIMGEFAAGERYLNRVWSASAEGYVDEASEYLLRAHRQFQRAKDMVDAL